MENRREFQIQKATVRIWKHESKNIEVNECIKYNIDDAYKNDGRKDK